MLSALLKQAGRRIAALWNRQQADQDLAEEMRLHLELRREENETGHGLAPVEAETAARRRFGNETLLREVSRDSWGWTWLEQALQDVRYAFRNMLRTPGFTLVAVLIIALGIGANAAIFSVVNGVLMRPLAYKDPEQLTTILHRGTNPVSPLNFQDWRERLTATSFESIAAAEFWTPNLTGADSPERIWGLRLTADMFPLLGVEPLLGRVFARGEDVSGSDHVVVLARGLWQRRFNGDRSILGKPLLLNGVSYTVIGVMPPTFQFAPFWATKAEIWAPLAFAPERLASRGGNSLRVFARLKNGVDLARARADVAAVTADLEREFPGSNRNVAVTPLKENVIGKVESPILIVMGAVGLVLLIACANVAHMLLARAASRQKEIALRSALGAGQARLIRQFLTEGLLLATLGAAAGIAFAYAAVRVLITIGPSSIPRLSTITIDPPVLAFAAAIAAFTGIAFSLAPALHARTLELTNVLKETAKGSGSGGSVRLRRTRNILAVSEVALAFVLLCGAGLLIRSFGALRSSDPGFNPSQLVSLVVSVSGAPESAAGRRETFYREIVERAVRLPGVESAGAINHLPLAGDLWIFPFQIEGRPRPRPGESPSAVYRVVMPGYFQTARLPLLRGRDIEWRDDSRAPGAVIISQQTATQYWPGEDAIGKRITFDDGATWLTVTGIAKDAKQGDWTATTPRAEVYLAALQNHDFLTSNLGTSITLVLRTSSGVDPASIAPAAKSAIWAMNPNLPISEVQTMDSVVERVTAQPRFEMMLLVLFAAIALVIAMAGIYALMSFSVARRIQEIGVRLSLGATRGAVTWQILKQGLWLAGMGSFLGALVGIAMSRLMTGMLVGVRPGDPGTWIAVAAALNAAAVLATYIPARRAARVDPIIALRHE
jgi:predicted permease